MNFNNYNIGEQKVDNPSWIRRIGLFLIAAVIIFIAFYWINRWVQAQEWFYFRYSFADHILVSGHHVAGWRFLKYGWPAFLVGAGLASGLGFLLGAWFGNLITRRDYIDALQALEVKKQNDIEQLSQLEQRLKQVRQKLEADKEQHQQEQNKLVEEKKYLANYKQDFERAYEKLYQEKQVAEAKMKEVFTERDDARQRAKRLQEELKAVKKLLK